MKSICFLSLFKYRMYSKLYYNYLSMSKKEKMRPKQKPQSDSQPEAEAEKEQTEQEFSLYALLQVDKKASKDEIKKQYRKLVLQYHPDKNKEDPNARQTFQKLKQAYDILMDDQKRQQYDQTGQVGDEFNENTFQSAYNYFRKMYKPISKQDIESFEKQYRFGLMEKEDLLDYYEKNEGNMQKLLECIPLSNNEDIPRFIAFFEEQIDNEIIPKYKAFDKTKGKVKELVNQEKEFAEEQKKDMNALVLAIQNKSKANTGMDFIASLEQKYGAGKKQKVDKKKEQKPKNKVKK